MNLEAQVTVIIDFSPALFRMLPLITLLYYILHVNRKLGEKKGLCIHCLYVGFVSVEPNDKTLVLIYCTCPVRKNNLQRCK